MRDTFCPWYRVKEYKAALKPIIFYEHALQYYNERITMNTIIWLFTYQILQTYKISVNTLYAIEKLSNPIMLMYNLLWTTWDDRNIMACGWSNDISLQTQRNFFFPADWIIARLSLFCITWGFQFDCCDCNNVSQSVK